MSSERLKKDEIQLSLITTHNHGEIGMIKHIVMRRLFEFAEGKTKNENALKLRGKLLSLPGKIPQIKKMEVGINIDQTEVGSDVVLYSEFNIVEDLRDCQKHPEHLQVIDFLNKVRSEKSHGL